MKLESCNDLLHSNLNAEALSEQLLWALFPFPPPTLFKENKLNIKDYILLYHSIFLRISLFLCFVVSTLLQ